MERYDLVKVKKLDKVGVLMIPSTEWKRMTLGDVIKSLNIVKFEDKTSIACFDDDLEPVEEIECSDKEN